MELGGFSMDLSQSLSLSLSMSMEDGWTQRLLKRSYAEDAHDDMKLVKAWEENFRMHVEMNESHDKVRRFAIWY